MMEMLSHLDVPTVTEQRKNIITAEDPKPTGGCFQGYLVFRDLNMDKFSRRQTSKV